MVLDVVVDVVGLSEDEMEMERRIGSGFRWNVKVFRTWC
jgi:hypothetical protein